MAAEASAPTINCLMLVTWPQRRQMTQEALISFLCQDHANRVLTVVNDGEPCCLTQAFHARCRGSVIQVPPGTTIGEKRNAGTQAVAADYIASFDDDDFSLPGRLTDHLASIGDAVWLSAGRKYIALQELDKIVGFEYGRCFGAGMISAELARRLEWPALNWCEDQRLYEAAKADGFGGRGFVEADALNYVHRRHETNASAAHRQSLWQGVVPLQLAGAEAMGAPAQVASLLQQHAGQVYIEDAAAAPE
jgi:hypothetical protein